MQIWHFRCVGIKKINLFLPSVMETFKFQIQFLLGKNQMVLLAISSDMITPIPPSHLPLCPLSWIWIYNLEEACHFKDRGCQCWLLCSKSLHNVIRPIKLDNYCTHHRSNLRLCANKKFHSHWSYTICSESRIFAEKTSVAWWVDTCSSQNFFILFFFHQLQCTGEKC